MAGKDYGQVYLNLQTSKDRKRHLGEMMRAGRSLPLDLVEDLLRADLPADEQRLVLAVADAKDPVAYEDLLSRGVFVWEPEVATFGLRTWSRQTTGLFSQRLASLAKVRGDCQRLIHTVYENADRVGPALFAPTARPEFEQMSEATFGLLATRFIEWNTADDKILYLAEKTVGKTTESSFTGTADLPFALAYLARFAPAVLDRLVASPHGPRRWLDMVQSYRQVNVKEQERELVKLANKPPKKVETIFKGLYRHWFPLWARHEIEQETLNAVFKLLQSCQWPQDQSPPPFPGISCFFFGGIQSEKIAAAHQHLVDEKLSDTPGAQRLWETTAALLTWQAIEPLAPFGTSDQVMTAYASLRSRQSKDVKAAHAAAKKAGHWTGESVWSAAALDPMDPLLQLPSDGINRKNPRAAYFDAVIHMRQPHTDVVGSPWSELAQVDNDPKKYKSAVAKAGLALPPALRTEFFRVVNHYPGDTDLLPPLSGFTKSTEEHELSSLASCLDANGSPGAITMLMQLLGRNGVGESLKLDICAYLTRHDVTSHQDRLREIHRTLTSDPTQMTARTSALAEAVTSLISAKQAPVELDKATDIDRASIERELTELIPAFPSLEPDVKRALRTARLIFRTITHREGIDISPSVDMQYKALEILFRNRFDDLTFRTVSSGVLQRKLDRIGYTRAAKGATDTFENYLSSLPVIRDVPGFSRFKLSKLLRSIANFKPGRRFTLDSLKAYGFFFLVFGRSECSYGLAHTLDLSLKDDQALADFFRNLHLFQDIRNRAVHEGLPAEVAKDVEAIWHMTASILQKTLELEVVAPAVTSRAV